jgi:hypothetical protein
MGCLLRNPYYVVGPWVVWFTFLFVYLAVFSYSFDWMFNVGVIILSFFAMRYLTHVAVMIWLNY